MMIITQERDKFGKTNTFYIKLNEYRKHSIILHIEMRTDSRDYEINKNGWLIIIGKEKYPK
jgi:hypothetical protein